MPSLETITISKDLADKLRELQRNGETVQALLSRMADKERVTRNPWTAERKILVLGPANSGKSTIRKVFFEDADPGALLGTPLEPTMGVETRVYDWLDLKIGVSDSSGQEIDSWFDARGEDVFSGSDAIIYIFDMAKWDPGKDEIIDQVVKLLRSRHQHAPDARVTIFVHKKDLIEARRRSVLFQRVQDEINGAIHEAGFKSVPEYHNTSLVPDHVLDITRALRNILFKYSAVLRRAMIPVALRE